MSKWESNNPWNFENMSKLLKAELHYLDGQLESAEDAYKASIKSARDHKFIHEEALAHELYGIFCIETRLIDKGFEHLRIAVDKYKTWGAMKKADDLQHFIDVVDSGMYELDYPKWISYRKQMEGEHDLTVLSPLPPESADDGVMEDALKICLALGSTTGESSCSSTTPPTDPSLSASTPEEGTAKPSAAGGNNHPGSLQKG
ncbi:hypothetical protein ACHAXR_003358 [Thalassiosira sp. AJA248-18]